MVSGKYLTPKGVVSGEYLSLTGDGFCRILKKRIVSGEYLSLEGMVSGEYLRLERYEKKRESSFVTNSSLVLLVRLSSTLFSELPQTHCWRLYR